VYLTPNDICGPILDPLISSHSSIITVIFKLTPVIAAHQYPVIDMAMGNPSQPFNIQLSSAFGIELILPDMLSGTVMWSRPCPYQFREMGAFQVQVTTGGSFALCFRSSLDHFEWEMASIKPFSC
jgi:hypothetical protein